MHKTVRIGSGLGFFGDSWEPAGAAQALRVAFETKSWKARIATRVGWWP